MQGRALSAGESQLVLLVPRQANARLHVAADTDFAGCAHTKGSTSGGCASLGTHHIKHWSSTQRQVTMSSGEAELSGVVRAAAEGLGLQSIARDLGIECALDLHTDSSAAEGISKRSGIGKVRHLAVAQLWVQERLRAREFWLFKISGDYNPADLLTKHVARDHLLRHSAAMGAYFEGGRAKSAPQLNLLARTRDYGHSRLGLNSVTHGVSKSSCADVRLRASSTGD